MTQQLHTALHTHGYCLLTTPKTSRAGRIIQNLRESIHRDLFPDDNDDNNGGNHLETSTVIYLSERDVPMYFLGYDRTDDIREVYRVAAGHPDDQPWPKKKKNTAAASATPRGIWLRALGFMRHLTDVALALLLEQHQSMTTTTTKRIQARPYSGSSTWLKDRYACSSIGSLSERNNDFSVLYAMHYFGNSLADEQGIAVKQHVDPSLLVIEPFLSPDVQGLQVWNRSSSRSNDEKKQWIDCDGPDSPMHLFPNHEVMVLFVGKALQEHIHLEPTIHRVVTPSGPRRTVIYEQKYGEFY